MDLHHTPGQKMNAFGLRALFSICVLCALATACREQVSELPPIHPNPNMDQQLYFEAQEPNPMFESVDGRAMRPALPNTVGAGMSAYRQTMGVSLGGKERTKIYDEDWLATDRTYYKGYIPQMSAALGEGDACDAEVTKCKHSSLMCNIPPGGKQGVCQPQPCDINRACNVTDPSVCTDMGNGQAVCRAKEYEVALPSLLASSLSAPANAKDDGQLFQNFMARGQDRYNIYCAPCHGENGGHPNDGGGSGVVAMRAGTKAGIVSYHSDVRRAFPIGRIFDTISAGRGKMPAFGPQIPPRDRWAIALYVRALQRTQYIEASKLTQLAPNP
jgi:mono/diheme cytochrome c family protein